MHFALTGPRRYFEFGITGSSDIECSHQGSSDIGVLSGGGLGKLRSLYRGPTYVRGLGVSDGTRNRYRWYSNRRRWCQDKGPCGRDLASTGGFGILRDEGRRPGTLVTGHWLRAPMLWRSRPVTREGRWRGWRLSPVAGIMIVIILMIK